MDLEWLNYNHLRYFWVAAREGGVTRAARKLNISQPTVSAQIRELEEALGAKLFMKRGRHRQLTELGGVVYRYAEEIFGLGRELLNTVRGRATERPPRLTVGISNVVPKLIAYRLLAPAFALADPPQIVCHEERADRLLAQLAIHELDLVLTDAPVGPGFSVRAYNHLLGESGAAVFGATEIASRYGAGFPESLDGAPFLLPTDGSALRSSLEQWFHAHQIRPRVVGEFEDSALLKVFGEAGRGLFAAPLATEVEVKQRYRVDRLGVIDSVRERFYVISVERRLRHPAVVAISQAARHGLLS
jgi:LysR family transcriptional activator of nhaA